MLKIIRESRKANKRLTISQFKDMVKEQFQLVLLDEDARSMRCLSSSARASLTPTRRWTPCASSSWPPGRWPRRKRIGSVGSRGRSL